MAKVLSYSDQRAYFKSIADGIILLNPDNDTAKTNFYLFPDQFIGNNLRYPAMVFIPGRVRPFDKLSDNRMKAITGEIWILDAMPKQNETEQLEKIDRCESILEEVLAKMKSDNLDYSTGTDRTIQYMDVERCSYEPISGVNGQNAGGWALLFEFSNAKDYSINNSLWY
jgi:hypothetical protein